MTCLALMAACTAGFGAATLVVAPPAHAVTTEHVGSTPAVLEGAVSPYAATPDVIVQAMLKLARVGPQDYVVDMGSGDGRVVIAAASTYGARGLGVEIDPSLVAYSQAKAAEAGVADRAQFAVRDLFATDVSRATVVTVYLLPIAMNRLQAKLMAELAPGTRIVSHDYALGTWRAERVMTYDVPEKNDYTGRRQTSLYLYTVPPRATAPN